MQILRIISLIILLIIDLTILYLYILSIKEDEFRVEAGRNIILLFLTIFMMPTIYIILN